jgi:periplasmic divalent cation tolerance protein
MIINKTSQDKMVFVYTTCADRAEAKHLAFSAVEEKLAICADFWPIESIYPWQGVVQDVTQYMVVFTTEKSLSMKLASFVGGLHSYSVPMIAECDTAFTSPAYSIWADKILHSQSEDYISEHDAYKKQINDEEDGYHPGRLK